MVDFCRPGHKFQDYHCICSYYNIFFWEIISRHEQNPHKTAKLIVLEHFLLYNEKVSLLIYSGVCDQAYENQPCSHTNIAQFLSYHNFCSVNTNTLQSLTEMQNLMEDLIKLTE